MQTSKNFTWINFREWPVLKNFVSNLFSRGFIFAWIYFREKMDFEKYFCLKKRKTTLLSIESFYKSSKNYECVNNFYMFDGVWSMKASIALSSSSRTYLSSNETKIFCSFSKSWTSSVISRLKISEKGEEEGHRIGKMQKHVLFESAHTNFKYRRGIFKIYFAWINFRE